MFYQTFLSPQVKRCAIITYKQLPNDLTCRKLENIRKVSKLSRMIAQCPAPPPLPAHQIEAPANISEKPLNHTPAQARIGNRPSPPEGHRTPAPPNQNDSSDLKNPGLTIKDTCCGSLRKTKNTLWQEQYGKVRSL